MVWPGNALTSQAVATGHSAGRLILSSAHVAVTYSPGCFHRNIPGAGEQMNQSRFNFPLLVLVLILVVMVVFPLTAYSTGPGCRNSC